MRRARFKLAPNVASVSRASQTKTDNIVKDTETEVAAQDIGKSSDNTDISANENTVTASSVQLPPSTILEQHQALEKEVAPTATNPLLAAAIASPPLNKHLSNPDSKNTEVTKENSEFSVKDTSQPAEHQPSTNHRFKQRPKIRPVLHDGPHRVRTISSTSESEDDMGRRLSRPPLSPVKKTVPELLEDVDEAVKKSKERKPKREKTALDLKKEALKRKLARGNIDRSQLTMFDLIYYNPVEKDKP